MNCGNSFLFYALMLKAVAFWDTRFSRISRLSTLPRSVFFVFCFQGRAKPKKLIIEFTQFGKYLQGENQLYQTSVDLSLFLSSFNLHHAYFLLSCQLTNALEKIFKNILSDIFYFSRRVSLDSESSMFLETKVSLCLLNIYIF